MFTGINRGVPGGFAPRIVAHKSQLFRVPEGLSLKAAVMTEPVAVALQTVFDNLPVRNEKILVIGCGVIGNLIVQSLRVLAPETQISVIELSAFAARLAVEMGADEIVPANDSFAYAAGITGARLYKPIIGKEISMGGFARIYDTVGSSATLNLSLRLLAARGTLSVVGIGGDAKLDLTPLWLKLQTVKGVYAYGRVTYDGKECHVFDVSLELMQKNKIEAARLVTHQFRLEDYRQMIKVNLNKEKHAAVKTVVSFDWE